MPIKVSLSADEFDITDLKNSIVMAIENFSSRGSNWILQYVIRLCIRPAPYRPLQGSSYIETPKELVEKHCLVNVQNKHDSCCFPYSILAQLHPATINVVGVTNY